ncbi:c-type cytochrome [Minwuia sp.]|uniref:c-type cytochrome n=1 Tax=Minwuia sp. TaxID=2493630 RepID=UPI003A95BDFE
MKKLMIVGAAMVFAAGAAFAGAHGSMSDQRVKAMKGVGGAMKAIGDGEGDAVQHAQTAKLLMGDMLKLFPEGSAEYRAKPNIWTDWDGFKAAMEKTDKAAAALLVAAEGGDRAKTLAALGDMGKTCKACHEEYRGPKPKE